MKKSAKPKILMCGGGTMGHVFPALSLVPYLNNFEIHFASGKNEKNEIEKYPNVFFHQIDAPKFYRKNITKNLLLPIKFYKAKKDAKKLIEQIKPDIIFSKGGYVALPIVFASKNIPIVCHESDLSMGLANKLCLKKCNIMITSFKQTANRNAKCKFIGQPIRKQIFCGNAKNVQKYFPNNGRANILFVGGSSGSNFLNEAVAQNQKALSIYNVALIRGKNKITLSEKNIICQEFASNIEDFYAWADVVVCRSGSGIINELIALQKPMLCIPLPKKASRGDQIKNAKYFEKLGLCKVLLQENYTPQLLQKNIEEILINANYFKKNAKNYQNNNVNQQIVAEIQKLLTQ